MENQSSYKWCCFSFLQRDDRAGNLCQEGRYNSPKTKHCVQPWNNKSSSQQIHSSSRDLTEHKCSFFTICICPCSPLAYDQGNERTKHKTHKAPLHSEERREAGNFKYSQIKIKQRVVPPGQPSLMNRNLWFLHAVANGFTAPSFLSHNNNHFKSAPVKLKLLTLLGIAAVIHLILLILIVIANLQQSPPHSLRLRDSRQVLGNR